MRIVCQGNGERFAEGNVGETSQLLPGFLAYAGVIVSLLQLYLSYTQLATIQPDKGTADPLIVLSTLATSEMNIERDAHAVLQRLTEGLRNHHAANLLYAGVSSAGIRLNEQKDHAEGKPCLQFLGNPS